MDIEHKKIHHKVIDANALSRSSECDRRAARKSRAAQRILPQAAQGIMSVWLKAAPSWRNTVDLDRSRLESD